MENGRAGPRKSDPGEKSRRRFFNVPRLRADLGELMTLTDPLDVAEQNREAEAGLKLIRSGSRLPYLINQTALRLQFAGRVCEAYDLTREMDKFLEWRPIDHYGMACYASQIGSWKEAAEELLTGLGNDTDLAIDFERMFSDLDFEPLYQHAAEGEMDMETALVLANPRFASALSQFAGQDVECDVSMLRAMPPHFRPSLVQDLWSGLYDISPQASPAVQTQYREWFLSVSGRIASLARRGIARAQAMVLESQLDPIAAGAAIVDRPEAQSKSTGKRNASPIAGPWTVIVADNFDFIDEYSPCYAGSYPTYEEALASAQRIVEASVKNSQGTTAEEIYAHYTSFGDDAVILAPKGADQPESRFSSWIFAKEIAGEIAKQRSHLSKDVNGQRIDDMQTSGKLSDEIMKTHADESNPQEYEEKKA